MIAQSLWIDIPQRIRRAAHSSLRCPAGTSRESPVGHVASSSARVLAPTVFERLVEAPHIRYAYSALLIPKFLRSHVSGAAKFCSAEISSSSRGRPNRKWPTHAHWSLWGRWCRVGAGSIPRIGQAFGSGAGSRGLAGLHAVKRAAAPTGIVHALDAKRILRYASLGRSRNAIDHPEACCSEQRGEGCTDHFRTFELARPFPCRQLCIICGSRGVDEYIKIRKHQSGSTKQIVLVSWSFASN